ncbi:OB-fold domain-containing protein [Actinomadura sp. 7K507]|uniref:thiolase C-terminal domain-containing protein n=1 Tax=Actinomadura sp. 7K507 TaxID=2530365 RepID=UPI0014052477
MAERRVDQFQIDGFAEGRILVQRCAECAILHNPPRAMCPNCHSLEWEHAACGGLGTVYSWIVPRHGALDGETHIVAVVELEEGVRLLSRIRDVAIADMRNGLPVEARFEEDEQSGKNLVFRPAGTAPKPAAVIDRDWHPVPESRPRRPKDVLWERTAISGIGQTEFSKDSGRAEISLAAEACLAAIKDAGLTPADIDGMVTFTQETNSEVALMGNLGIPELTFDARGLGGGMAATACMQIAASAVLSGAATNVLVYRAFNERSGRRFGVPARRDGAPAARSLNTPAAIYALWYQRYMDTFGVSNEDLGRYSVVARKHAAGNPNAWFHRRPITLEEHQQSRWIVEPVLRLLDCCQESDGGVALVVSSLDQAEDGPNPPVRLLAAAQGYAKGNSGPGPGPLESDLSRFADCRVSARQAFRDAGLSPGDIGAAMIYENFTPLVFLTLEELGFCGPGEAKDFIAEGHIEIGGTLPVNTHGGLLGEAYIHGLNNTLEAVRQLRGVSSNQVEDCQNVLVSNGVGTLIYGRA